MLGRLDSIEPCKDGYAVKFTTATVPRGFDGLQDKDLDITAKIHRNKRSNDANAYYRVLVRELAQKQTPPLSETEMHNVELARYGQWQLLPDGTPDRAIKPPSWDWRQQVNEHYQFSEMTVRVPCKMRNADGTIFTVYEQWPLYWVIRGSHTYDTKEMSILIDGVVEDAKEQGIEVLTPDEIARMMEAYDEAFKRKQISQPAHDC